MPDPPTTFEALAAFQASLRGPLTVITICRPVSEPLSTNFLECLAGLFEWFAVDNTQLVVVSDVNLHLEDLGATGGKGVCAYSA